MIQPVLWLFLWTVHLGSHQLGTRVGCAAYGGLPEMWGRSSTAGMVWVAGGAFVPGTTKGYPEEKPGAKVRVVGFWIDRTEVTNAQFADFVDHTHYVTAAERSDAAPVFHIPTTTELERTDQPWWTLVKGANWRHPIGPQSDARGVQNQPVVQVAYEDALAYAHWLGHALPTEAQWEFAARGGRPDDELQHAPRDRRGNPAANFWQGEFPAVNSADDGFVFAAPVGCFPGNGYGLYDSVGNVWEWTADAYAGSHQEHDGSVCPKPATGNGASAVYVIKGGSFLCAPNYCARYRPSARHPQEADMPAMHIGFRTVATNSSAARSHRAASPACGANRSHVASARRRVTAPYRREQAAPPLLPSGMALTTPRSFPYAPRDVRPWPNGS